MAGHKTERYTKPRLYRCIPLVSLLLATPHNALIKPANSELGFVERCDVTLLVIFTKVTVRSDVLRGLSPTVVNVFITDEVA